VVVHVRRQDQLVRLRPFDEFDEAGSQALALGTA